MSDALWSAWQRTVRTRGAERAIVQAADGHSCTFEQLDAGARALGFNRRELQGRAVVFALPNGIQWLEVFLALVRAGAVAVPLDAAEPVAAQHRIVEVLRAGFWWDGAKLVAHADARRFSDPTTCLIKLTSGTTGTPRPLVFTDAQMLADGHQVTRTMGIRHPDVNYGLIPFGHSYGLGNLTLPLLAHGIPIVVGSAPLPHVIAQEFEQFRPTVFPSVPAVFRALVASDIKAPSLSALRLAISAGAPLAPEIAQSFAARFERRIHAFYGSSETGGIAFDRTGDATLRGGVGRAMHGVRITLRRGERLEVQSAAVFTHGNRRRRDGQGCWVPPDRASVAARGEITLLGRRGSTVKIGGRRVNLAEVGARLQRLNGVREVWVGASTGSEPTIGAALVSERSVAELRAEVLADTAPWKVPKKWTVLRAFPLTARGKTDARALQALVFQPRS